MPVVAHGVYTYVDRFAPFVYDVVSHHQRYRPVIFSYGVGVHKVYRQYPVYAPNALDGKILPSNPNKFRYVSNKISQLLSILGIRQLVLRSLQRRGSDALVNAIHREQVRLFHAHFGSSGVKFLPLCRQLKLPMVVSTYGYDLTSLPLSDLEYRQNLIDLFDYASFVFAMSRDMRARLLELGCPEDKAVIHHTSIDVDDFAYRAPREDVDTLRILTVCNYVEKKGLPYLVKALALVKKQAPNVELRIVGRPSEPNAIARELDRLIADLGLEDTVHQEGFIPFEMLPEEFAQADIFALPSVIASDGDQEGIPTVLLEAQSSGLPVVSTRHAGIPDAVLDGKTGFLAPERDVEQLADRLLKLVLNFDLRREMGKSGREYIEQEFNIHRQMKRLEEIYDSVIKRIIE